jgi:hypothetical protein
VNHQQGWDVILPQQYGLRLRMDLRKSLQRMNLVPEKHRGVDLDDDMDEFNRRDCV